MMRHPAVHIALIVLIALLLTLVARGCDGDHESELPDDQAVTEAPLPAPVVPAEPLAPAPSPARQETKAPGKPNPCLKRTPAPGVSSSSPATESGAPAPVDAGPRPSPPSPAPADTPAGPGKDVSVMPYAKGSRPCIKGPPAGRSAPADPRSPDHGTDEPAPPAPSESVRVLPPPKGSNPCVKGPAVRGVAPTPPSLAAATSRRGDTPVPSPGPVPISADVARSADGDDHSSSGGGPRLASSLDDGPPTTQRMMRRGGEPSTLPPSSTGRLAASMDDSAPAPEDRHARQRGEGREHDHDTPAVAGGSGDSAPGGHSRHVERMKAGRHDDLSHVRVDPPEYPAPEKYHPGRNLYQAHCQSCHGDRGMGSDHAPPLLHPYYDPNLHGDDYFYDAVANGAQQHLWDYGNMPPLPHVSHEQVKEIISYVRWLQRQANIY